MTLVYVTSTMLLPGETFFEASERIRSIRALRANRSTPVDKLAERARLTRFWTAAYPQWQPDLCRIDPNFALVHIGSFRRGMLHGHLSLLPGHVAPHKRHLLCMRALRESNVKPSARGQLTLWAEIA